MTKGLRLISTLLLTAGIISQAQAYQMIGFETLSSRGPWSVSLAMKEGNIPICILSTRQGTKSVNFQIAQDDRRYMLYLSDDTWGALSPEFSTELRLSFFPYTPWGIPDATTTTSDYIIEAPILSSKVPLFEYEMINSAYMHIEILALGEAWNVSVVTVSEIYDDFVECTNAIIVRKTKVK